MTNDIPSIDAQKMIARDPATMAALRRGAEDVGFLTLHNTGLTAADMARVFQAYHAFFRLPLAAKEQVDMARTG
ncbi:MAG: 2-oxoglutarate and iron-dependent oxygenase domain-containing protein, partial [Pseudomonadota bacterium]